LREGMNTGSHGFHPTVLVQYEHQNSQNSLLKVVTSASLPAS
jgi:hypothetical protein